MTVFLGWILLCHLGPDLKHTGYFLSLPRRFVPYSEPLGFGWGVVALNLYIAWHLRGFAVGEFSGGRIHHVVVFLEWLE